MPAQPESDEVVEVLTRVSTWPPAKRLALAQELLQTLTGDLGARTSSHTSLKDLLGLLKTQGPPPSDEECDRILQEELARKHGV
jgi:hypothetical protein